MKRKLPFIFFLGLTFLGIIACETRYGDGDKVIYSCVKDGKPMLSSSPCKDTISDYLLLTDNGGVLSSFTVYIDLCSAYKVTVVGGYEVIGKPSFDHEQLDWYKHGQVRDSLVNVYSNSKCKYYSKL
jgi:hypothetical protein